MQLKKSVVALSISAGLVGGGVAGAVLGVPGISGAQDGATTTTTVQEADPAPDADAPDAPDAPDADHPKAEERLGEVLAPLVGDGTITQAQADKVIEALIDAAPDRGPGHGPGRGPGRGHRLEGLQDAAAVLGMQPDELREALRDGSTLAEVAQSKGVDPQAVIDALVADAKGHLDQAVTNGRITQEQADARLGEITERITDRVNIGRPPVGEDAPQGD